jgi:hypothetical protein
MRTSCDMTGGVAWARICCANEVHRHAFQAQPLACPVLTLQAVPCMLATSRLHGTASMRRRAPGGMAVTRAAVTSQELELQECTFSPKTNSLPTYIERMATSYAARVADG